jgi:hypothetical protein
MADEATAAGAPAKSNGKLIGIIAGIVGVVAIVVVICVFALGGGIKTIADFKDAIVNKRAINCVITQKDISEEVTMQTTADFAKIRLAVKSEDGTVQNMLAIRDDAVYVWDSTGEMALKTGDFTSIDDMVASLKDEVSADAEDPEDENFSFKCDSPSKADFSVPSDVDFVDLAELMKQYSSNSEDYDWDGTEE